MGRKKSPSSAIAKKILGPVIVALQLIAPGATPEQDVLIDEVTYDDDPPWPGLAAGFGSSLQLIDPAADNNRVRTGGGKAWPDSSARALSRRAILH